MRALTGTDPDRLKEEQARGITIDLGFAHLETDGVTLAFVDVPGHERFIRNMLAGAGGIDLVMLCVAADESVMPQTREHFQICRLLHVRAGVLVLTKTDAADRDMVDLAAMELRELVAGSFLQDAPMIALSSRSGEGLPALREALVALAAGLPADRSGGSARLPVDRVFSAKGFGTVVTGTLVSGRICEDEELVLLPAGRPVKARGVQVHGHAEQEARAGQRVAINLGGVDRSDVQRGDTVCAAGTLEPTRRLDVALDLVPETRVLRHGARVRFHQGTTEVIGRIAIAAPRGGEGTAAEVAPGASAYVRLRLEGTAVVTRGDRFILRAYSPPSTIGGGVVLDPQPPRSALRTPAAVDRLRRLDAAVAGPSAAEGAVLTFVRDRGAAGLPCAALVSRAGLDPGAACAIEARLVADGRVTRVGEALVDSTVLRELGARLAAAVEAHHRAEPLSAGLPREEARERLFKAAGVEVFDHVVATLAASGAVAGQDRLTLAGHQVSLSSDEARAREILERLLIDGGLAPPDMTAVTAAAGVPAAIVERIAALLVRQKRLIRLDGLLFHVEALAGLKRDVRELRGAEGGGARVDVAAFKARYGISRKFAIPLLEYLDRERVTRRVGDARVVL